jgi:nucleoside-diphosphate-sugar epimerase
LSKILITGASGFVGSYISPELSRNHSLYAISRSSEFGLFEEVFSWDNYTNASCDYDVVIHLAGLAHDTYNSKQEQEYFEVNHQLTVGLVNWINQSKKSVKLIYLSSIKVYEDSLIINEKTPKKPQSVYGQSKLAAENTIIDNLSSNHTYYILEPVMIYGIGNKGNLPKLYYSLSAGIPYPFGNWKNKRSILAIENLNYTITQLLKSKAASDYFIISDDATISTSEMIGELFKETKNTYIRWGIPKFLVRTLIKLTSIIGINTFNKLLGSLVVSNQKIKKVLKIEKLPFDVRSNLNLLGKYMEINKRGQ